MVDIFPLFWFWDIAFLRKPRCADAIENQIDGAGVGDFLGGHRRDNHNIPHADVGWLQVADGDFTMSACDYVDFLYAY